MKRIVIHSSTLFLAVVVLVSAAFAIGGVCGGAIPCECGDTVTADRTLVCSVDPIAKPPACTGDPNTPNDGHGLFVDADVTLNLGGCTIRGADGGVGVTLADGADVTAGKIVGFAIGVLGASEHVTVTGLRISETSDAAIDIVGEDTVIANNVLQRNEGTGVRVDAGNVTVRQNRIEDSGGCGMQLNGPHLTIDRNILLRNGECGIRIITVLGGNVVRNQVKYTSEGRGVIFENAHDLDVSLNVSLSADDDDPSTTGLHGFHILSPSTNNTFSRNVSSYNDGFGIRDESTGTGTRGTGNTYDRNRCTGNGLGKSSPAGLC